MRLLREFHYRWKWQLQATPEALWPFVADTNRFNRDVGFPAVEPQPSAETSSVSGRRRLRIRWRGPAVEYEEHPFEWLRPSRFGVVRLYAKGPIVSMRLSAELIPQPGHGTRLVYDVWAQPKNLLGLIAIPIQIGLLGTRKFGIVLRQYDALATSGTRPGDRAVRVHFAPGGHARLAALRERLLAQAIPSDLVARLAEVIERADDLSLARLRPYAVADSWKVPRRAVLELFLWATRVGLLVFQWDLLCPLCRGAKKSHSTLREVGSQVHCDTCSIDFTVNFDRFVELTFRPNPAIRQVKHQDFCLGGPQVTPHIVAQQPLAPGVERVLALGLDVGQYRVRALGLPGGQTIRVVADGPGEATLRAGAAGWPHGEPCVGPAPTLRLENATAREQLFILERMAWSDQAATAADVTALQLFRDLFASEALRPGEQISVGSLAVLFTDLCGSTRLYQEVGDAPAFGLVMRHFDVLRAAITEEGGAVVKTMGDAVMSVFTRPAPALRAILKAQQALASPPDGMRPLQLKAGMQSGPCIAVTLNDRLDYFGSVVNSAVRFAVLSSGRDIVMSEAVLEDPEVVEWLDRAGSRFMREPFEAELKGFGTERFHLWRITVATPTVYQKEDRQWKAG